MRACPVGTTYARAADGAGTALPADVLEAALVKLDSLNGAASMLDLRSPPGNYLEALRGEMKGLHSIRVNDQWRLVFRWQGHDAWDVRLTDYH